MLENSPVSTAEDIGCRQALRFHAVCAGNVQTWLNGNAGEAFCPGSGRKLLNKAYMRTTKRGIEL